MTQPGAAAAGGGDASAANQVTGNSSLSSLDGKTPALGQALAAASTPVVLTAIQQAALTPPAAIAGFALEAGNLASIKAKTDNIPAPGQALAAASTPVVLTAIQAAALTPPAAIAGFALEAGHLAAIDTATANIPAKGQALAAASTPVVLTAIQVAALTPPAAITGFALEATQLTTNTDLGGVTEAAPANDTASSGLNGRMQRLAQRITSLIALLPAALVNSRLDVNLGAAPATVTANATLNPETTKVIGTVNPPALTKGAASANGFSTQDLKDSGRNITNYFMAAVVATTNAEAMQSLTGYKGGIAVGATVTPAVVTAGKTYRITSVEITIVAVSAIGSALIRLRANLSGTGAVGSPLVKTWQIGMPAIFTAGAAMTYHFDYPEGIEFAAGTGIALGVLGEAADGVTATAIGKVMVNINGYEY